MTPLFHIAIALLSITPGAGLPSAAAAHDRATSPGRQVKVAAIAIGFGGNHDKKLRLAVEHLETAGRRASTSPACPRNSPAPRPRPLPAPPSTPWRSWPGSTPCTWSAPSASSRADGRQYNTAVLLDRQGKVRAVSQDVRLLGRGSQPGPRGRAGLRHRFRPHRHPHLLRPQFRRALAAGRAQGGRDRLLAQRLRWRAAAERLRHDPQLLRGGRGPGEHDR